MSSSTKIFVFCITLGRKKNDLPQKESACKRNSAISFSVVRLFHENLTYWDTSSVRFSCTGSISLLSTRWHKVKRPKKPRAEPRNPQVLFFVFRYCFELFCQFFSMKKPHRLIYVFHGLSATERARAARTPVSASGRPAGPRNRPGVPESDPSFFRGTMFLLQSTQPMPAVIHPRVPRTSLRPLEELCISQTGHFSGVPGSVLLSCGICCHCLSFPR